MMTLHKLHAGDGYTYLTRQVAGDEGRAPGQQLTDYYTASGNPPGRWVGTGAADLEVTGRVREDQMEPCSAADCILTPSRSLRSKSPPALRPRRTPPRR
jgi:hypothetical protein